MDISFSAEEIAFRDEVRAFFSEQGDCELSELLADGSSSPNLREGIIEWERRLNKRGWMAPGWPVEYGGQDWTPTQHYIFNSERGRAGALAPMPFGVNMLGPVIYTYGSEEQKARILPRILNSEDWWCQGYSEPNAGSDLASLQCKAERDGDEYVINGSKIWTTFAQHANWIFCLVRTDNSGRKQDGISFLLIEMNTPGVVVKPIPTISGYRHINEVYFDNVRVPIANLVGEEGKGWTYAKSLLVHERLSIAEVPESKYSLKILKEIADQEMSGHGKLLDETTFAQRICDVEIKLMALEYTELRVLAASAKGEMPGPESSLLKLEGSEIRQQLQELQLDAAGYYGIVSPGKISADDFGRDYVDRAQKQYFTGRAATIYGGSSEIQMNITAKSVLGL